MGRNILRVRAELDNLVKIRRYIESAAIDAGFQAEEIQDLVQAVDEAATNIIRHGYRGDAGEIEIEVVPEAEGLWIRMRDRGFAFDPTLIPQPDLSVPLEERPLGKLGFVFIRLMVDEIAYQRLGGEINQLSLWKKRRLPKGEERK